MKKKYKVVELFSGIGSQARALNNIGFNIEVQATCEWDIHAFVAYDAIFNESNLIDEVKNLSKEETVAILSKYSLSNDGKSVMSGKAFHAYSKDALKRILSAIIRTNNLVDITKVKGSEMPNKTDILTYSFPCQDLSNVGAFHGYNKGIDKDSNSRSSLLWQVGRILTEMHSLGKALPRYLVMENVPTLLSNRHHSNFLTWISNLEHLGYESGYYQLNAKDFGIPQNRPRLLMISVFVGSDHKKRNVVRKHLDSITPNSIVKDYRLSHYYNEIQIQDLLRMPERQNSNLWKEAVESTPNDTPSRMKIWQENPKIVDESGSLTNESVIRTITTKQDRHPNSGNIYFDSGIVGKSKFRYLTPRECMLFMGFTDEDYDRIIANNLECRNHCYLFPRDKIIRMAGNSIPIKLLEGFFYQLYKFEKLRNI